MSRASVLPPPVAPPKRRSRSGAARKASCFSVGSWGMNGLLRIWSRRRMVSATEDADHCCNALRPYLHHRLDRATGRAADLKAPTEVIRGDQFKERLGCSPVIPAGL